MSRILIVGDSWGEGEWNHICKHHLVTLDICGCDKLTLRAGSPDGETIYSITHRGLEKYLSEHGCLVKNISKGAISNFREISLCGSHTVEAYDYVFWFVTDPLRDYENKSLVAETSEDIKQIINQAMEQTLHMANDVFAECKNGVHIIGGVYAPDIKSIEKYDNIHVGCEHFYKLLDFDMPEDFRGANCIPGNTSNLDLKEEAIDYLDETVRIQWDLSQNKYPEYFTPDDNHPNRKAHKILAEYLISKFNLTPYVI